MIPPLSDEIRTWIKKHRNDDPVALTLRTHKKGDPIYKFAIEQIRAYQKARHKMPEWTLIDGLIWPPALSAEQSSSESTAKFKAGLFKGATAVDLTGGMGVDCYYLSKTHRQVVYVESDPNLCDLAEYNFPKLGAFNITVTHKKAEDFLSQMDQKVDLIFIDPSRRTGQKKVFRIADASPNILELLPALKKYGDHVLIKLSPFLDIRSVLQDVPGLNHLYVLGIDNECKELLCVIGKPSNDTTIVAVNLLSSGPLTEKLEFKLGQERAATPEYSMPLKYLFEPNASILKSGAFKYVAQHYHLNKLQRNTHLYTSNALQPFPGSVFRIEAICAYSAKALNARVGVNKFIIRIRNFPDDILTIKRKLKIKEGGNKVIFATTFSNNKPGLLICSRVSNQQMD